MHHDRRAEARLVGECAALEAPGDGAGHTVAQHTAARRLHGESAFEDGRERSRDRRDMGQHDRQRTQDVEQRHQRNDLFRHGRHTLQAAQDDQRGQHRQQDAGEEIRHLEGRIHVACDGVDLAHVADAKGGQHTEAGEQHRQHPAQLFAALLAAQTVGQVVHRAAGPLAVGVLAAVKDAQNVFRVVGHHAQDGHGPHPEDGTRPAAEDGRCHTHDVAGADGRRQRGAQALELADGLIVLFGMGRDVPVGEDGTDGVPQPVPEMPELEKTGAHRHHKSGAEQQRQPHRPPDDAVDNSIHARNGL